ncbi:hypothetical protein ACH3XW_26915 [Acanthocheilonema viteae]
MLLRDFKPKYACKVSRGQMLGRRFIHLLQAVSIPVTNIWQLHHSHCQLSFISRTKSEEIHLQLQILRQTSLISERSSSRKIK